MKKMLALVMALTVAVQLCACAEVEKLKNVELPPLPKVTAAAQAEPAATEAPAEQPTEEPAQETQAPQEAEATEAPVVDEAAAEAMKRRVTVNFLKTEKLEYDPADGRQLILSFSYVTPHVSIDERDHAAEAINEHLAMLEETYYTGNDYGDGPSYGYYGMLEQAEDNFAYVHDSGSDLPVEFTASRDVSLERADGRVLSFLFTEYLFTGGAHGMYGDRAYVYDTDSGELLTLDAITPDPEALRAFLVRRMMEQVEQDEALREEIDGYLLERSREEALTALLREGSWYLDEKGLVVFSDLYELASYAAGMQFFNFSYAELGELLDPRFLPGVKRGEGGFDFLTMDEVEEGSFTILDKLTMDGVQELCLKSGACVYDVAIRRAEYYDWSGSFGLGETLWYCSCMQNCGVQLTADLPDGTPNLALCYRSGEGELHRCLLTQSGEDGHLMLLEEGLSFSE